MRSRRHFKNSKNPYRRVNKKSNKSKHPLGCTPKVSIFDLENINEVLRVHKTQLAEGKGAWKVVPKDSCEVYKDRRKRQSVKNRHDTNTTDSDNDYEDNKKVNKAAVRRRRKPKERRRAKESSMSSSLTSTTTNSSCMSSSEIDYK